MVNAAEQTNRPLVPIENKLNLTIKEAAEYSNIGENRIDQMLRQENCSFVLYVGNRKLVKRLAFEQYLAGITYVA